MSYPYFYCNQKGECFGKSDGYCMVLIHPCEGKCPFQKKRQGASYGHIKIVAGEAAMESEWTSPKSAGKKYGKALVEDVVGVFIAQHPEECAIYKEITVFRKKPFAKFISNWQTAPAE